MMTIGTIAELLDAKILCAEDTEARVDSACGSDMMSDVLAYVKNQAVLLTGLVNTQVVRTASMMDMSCIVFVRSKAPGDDILALAREYGIAVLGTDLRMYDACGILYSNGLGANPTQCHE